jgi:hypothetical protein
MGISSWNAHDLAGTAPRFAMRGSLLPRQQTLESDREGRTTENEQLTPTACQLTSKKHFKVLDVTSVTASINKLRLPLRNLLIDTPRSADFPNRIYSTPKGSWRVF